VPSGALAAGPGIDVDRVLDDPRVGGPAGGGGCRDPAEDAALADRDEPVIGQGELR
jgi:hypothetical protein